MYDRIPVSEPAGFLGSIWMENDVSKAFFSRSNVDYLQEHLRKGVYERSRGKFEIGIQDEDQLNIIMRGIFLQNSKNLDNKISQQVHELNKLVLKYCINQVYNAALSYKKYIVDASTMYHPMSHPVLVKENRQLEFKRFF
jgi:hypothetical protein